MVKSPIMTRSLDSFPRIKEAHSPIPTNSSIPTTTKSRSLGGDKGLIRDVSVAIKTKFFSRKPRCLMFAGAGHSDLMITSSLDGSVQYNSVRKQMTTRTVFLPSYLKRTCYPDTMCSAPLLDGFVFSTADTGASNSVNVESDSSNQASSLVFLPYRYDSEPVPVVLTSTSSPHEKSISTLSSLHEPVRSSRAKLLSGGLDKSIVLWELDYQACVIGAREVHRCHTSGVQAITQVAASPEILWSGGADSRLLGWSLKESRPTFKHRYESRISQLLTNANHPNSIMATFCSRSQQLRLLDHRGPLGQGFKAFGHSEQSPTRYMRPGWSPDGNLVAFGTSVPDSRISAVNIWDLRYMNEASAPVRSIEFSGEKRFLGCEFWPSGNVIVAIGTDNSANFVDFTTS
jgi:WD40 repeat protein